MLTAAEVTGIGGKRVLVHVTADHRFGLDELLDAALVVSMCHGDPRAQPSGSGTLGRQKVWAWTEAAAYVTRRFGAGSVRLLRSLVAQFRLEPADQLPSVFYAQILVLMTAGVTQENVERWWRMKTAGVSRPLELGVATAAVVRWGPSFVDDCARAGLTSDQLRLVIQNA